MFKEDDDDDGDEDTGQSRYPVMPSLVAMQLMKNRLHLAYLGRKLMKWTAMATGKELRRLGLAMNTHYDNYGDNVSKAYLLLARARYFCPKMNIVVLENVGNSAAIAVEIEKRSITGVKVIDWVVVDSGVDPYAHLGIGSGGSAIAEAKLAWKELLKMMILMLQEKTTFKFLDEANKNATKRQNVLGKVMVPRIILTLRYIAQELEENEREEFFRLTKIQDMKNKMYSVRTEDKPKAEVEKISEEVPYSAPKPYSVPVPKATIPEEIGPCPKCADFLNSREYIKKRREWEGNLQNLKKEIHSVIAVTENKGLKEKDTDEFLKEANDLIRLLDKTLSTPDQKTIMKPCTCKNAPIPIQLPSPKPKSLPPPPPPPPPLPPALIPCQICQPNIDRFEATMQPRPPPSPKPKTPDEVKSSKPSIKSGAQSPCSSTSHRQDLELGTPKPQTTPAQAPCAVCVTEPKPVPPPAPIRPAVQSPCPATCRQHDLELGRPTPQPPPSPVPKPAAQPPCVVCQSQMVAPKLQPPSEPKPYAKSPIVSVKSLSARSPCASTCGQPKPQPVPKPTAPAPCPVCQPQKVEPVTPKPQPPKLKTPEKSPARSPTPSHKSLSVKSSCASTGRHPQPQPTAPPCSVCQPQKVRQITPEPQPTKLKSPAKSPARSPMASYKSLPAHSPCASTCHHMPTSQPKLEPTLTAQYPCPVSQSGVPSPQTSYVQKLYDKFRNVVESLTPAALSNSPSPTPSTYRARKTKTRATEPKKVRTIDAVPPKPSPTALPSPRSRASVGSKESIESIILSSIQTSNLELGTFETHTNITTKILRTIDNDGVVSEEKKVIKVQKTIRTRQSKVSNNPSEQSCRSTCNRSNQSSGRSTPTYGCCEPKCCEMLTFKSSLPQHNIPKTYSEIITRYPSLADPNIRSCISFSNVYIFDDRSTDDLCLDISEEKNTGQIYKNQNYSNGRLHNFTNSEDELITRADQRRSIVIPKSKSVHDTKKNFKDATKSRSFNVIYYIGQY